MLGDEANTEFVALRIAEDVIVVFGIFRAANPDGPESDEAFDLLRLVRRAQIEMHLVARSDWGSADLQGDVDVIAAQDSKRAAFSHRPELSPSALLQNTVMSSRSWQLMTVLPSRSAISAKSSWADRWGD